ncbi:MAG: hypothetical protein K5629_04375 [Eubacteriales bacterium]|nr:hypothetical protein [Eubacteriales bacterium]
MKIDKYVDSRECLDWMNARDVFVNRVRSYRAEMGSFYSSTMKAFLSGEKKQNRVYSPVNVYIALAMLAEITEGETRKQIADLLNEGGIDGLREKVGNILNSNSSDNPVLTCLINNSVWMNDSVRYNDDTVSNLSRYFRSEAFSVRMGDRAANKKIAAWINKNTGDLLSDIVEVDTDPLTALELISAIYYKASWKKAYELSDTSKEVFHGEKKDVTVDMMHKSEDMRYYWGERFTAVSDSLEMDGDAYFFLPKKGISLNELLDDSEVWSVINERVGNVSAGEPFGSRNTKVNLSLPRFRVSSKMDLIPALKDLGVKEVFDHGKADFSPLTPEAGNIGLDRIEHAAMAAMDEGGVLGTAYTEASIRFTSIMIPEKPVDFIVDRPFFFVITSRDGSLLFSGTVWDID